jgi:hypothetical protein
MRARKNSPYNVLNPNRRAHINIITRLRNLRHREHESTVEIIESLVQCNREKAYLEHGCSTLWDFLVRELKYSNAAASRRYKAMKCAERFPQVIDMLRKHQLSLSTLAQAESLLGEVNDPNELLERLAGKSHREVERVVAVERLVPRKPKEIVHRLALKPRQSNAPLLEAPGPEPVEERVTLRTSLSIEKFEAFEEARAIVSRKHPGASVEDVFNEMVEFFLKHRAPRPRKPGNPKPRTRHIPVAIRDQVMLRDKQRCTFKSRSGRKCNSTHNLQIDHIKPFALGGTHEPENLRVLCAAHNRHVARKVFDKLSLPAPEVVPGPTSALVAAGNNETPG